MIDSSKYNEMKVVEFRSESFGLGFQLSLELGVFVGDLSRIIGCLVLVEFDYIKSLLVFKDKCRGTIFRV